MASKAQSRTVRVRKLGLRTPIPIFREDEVEQEEYQVALTQLAKVSTGVESNEETEYHLQALIAEPLQKDKEIPTGEKARPSNINYDELYTPSFRPSAKYIAFSQTVEDCTGCQYDMSSEDAEYLKGYNKGRPLGSQLSEDNFERLMAAFEEYANVQTPFASIDKTISPWPEMQIYLKEELEEGLQSFAKDVYEYWRDKKLAADRGHIQPCLKLETQQGQQETDDNDAYVCFRRREVRQTRKTRARDQQSSERLRTLRKNLEDGRTLVKMALDRDRVMLDLLDIDRQIFAQRSEVKDVKVMLGLKTEDDELLINQRPPKRKMIDTPQMQRPPPGSIRFPPRGDGRAFDAELPLLSDKLAEKENILQREVERKMAEYRAVNQHWIDCTRDPLSPVLEQSLEGFRPATASYLITPPASASEESAGGDFPSPTDYKSEFGLSCASDDQRSQPAYRRRIGRGKRLWIDRRGLPSPAKDFDPNDRIADRNKFDHDDDELQPVYHVDPYTLEAMAFRASIPISLHYHNQVNQVRRAIAPGSQQGSPGRPSPASQLRPNPASQLRQQSIS